ncbi:MAG: alpha/beta hydrolase [Pseudomonadota bacterium]
MVTRHISGHNGVRLEVTDLGPADAPAIVLLHGWSQAALSWARQHPLAEDFRLIIPDLRGHGQSDKPDTPDAYGSQAFADDVEAIIAELGLTAATLVGWSMGGWVVGDYIRHHGDAALAGFALVGSSVASGKALPAAALEERQSDPAIAAAGMFSGTLVDNLTDTAAFLRACFHQQPDPQDFEQMMGFNMLCPLHARAMRRRNDDFTADYARTTKPALVIRGKHERLSLPQMHAQILQTLPRAQAFEYENSGHAPFWEEAARFNTDLANFVREAQP